MSQDHYLKLVLTVIAVALSVIAIAQLDSSATASTTEPGNRPEVDERSSLGLSVTMPRPAQQEERLREEPSGAIPRAPTSTLPLRWRIPFARHTNSGFSGFMDCATVVSVVGFGPDPIDVDVEFFHSGGGSVGLSSFTLDTPGEPDLHWSNNDVDASPFNLISGNASTASFHGYALVFADDSRIFVGAYLVCHEEGGSGSFPAVLTDLSAFPVGQTATFFQAGMPQMAPMTLTEPES